MRGGGGSEPILSDDVPCIIAETSTLITRPGVECALYKWRPPPPSSSSSLARRNNGKEDDGRRRRRIRGIAVVYHGFGAHSLYPTVRYASSLLAEHGLMVYGLDLPGHGASPGKRGLLTSVEDMIDDGIAVARYAAGDNVGRRDEGTEDEDEYDEMLPLFLVGSSMGGAMALAVSSRIPSMVRGVIMLAPMLSLNVSPRSRMALSWLNAILPHVPIIPSSATRPEMQYRDSERRAECERNTLTYKGKLRCVSILRIRLHL